MIAGKLGQQVVRNESGSVADGPPQHLFQVGHGREQAAHIGKRPAPASMLREDEYQSAPGTALLRPEQHAVGPGWLTHIGVGKHDPRGAYLLKPGTGGGM